MNARNNFETPSIKDYLVKSIALKLTETEKAIRKEILTYIIKNHKPFPTDTYKHKLLLQIMAEKNLLSFDEKGDVQSIYPISAIHTNKKVIFENGDWAYAMCAIDAIGCHYAFSQKVTIEGECQHCGEKLRIQVEKGKVTVLEGPEDIYILHTDLESTTNWSCYCCNIMHFFTCKETLTDWVKENNIQSKVIPVDLETANKISWLLFSN